MREPAGSMKGLTKCSGDPTGKSRRAFNANLLAEDRSRRQFETVPTARYSQTGMCFEAADQFWICAEAFDDGRPICVQIKHGADPLHDEEQRAWIAKLHTRNQRVSAFVK